MKIRFCGAAEGVTGSCHQVITDSETFLLDCGMFQGNKANEAKNREKFPFSPSEISFVLLSHAHVDHCGRLPLLVKHGFTGPIYCTDATADLVAVMLRDSAYIQEKETEYQNKKNERLGRKKVEPLYTIDDVEETLKYVTPVLYGSEKDINDNIRVRFTEAGHILGSAAVELWIKEKNPSVNACGASSDDASSDTGVTKLVFSGDVGVSDRPILRDPQPIKDADLVIMETTYGNRMHPANNIGVNDLANAVIKTIKRGGTVIIPAFAVGRTQDIIYDFNQLYAENKEFAKVMKDITVYVDSPMAQTATEVFKKNAQVFDDDARRLIMNGDNPISFANLRFVESVLESQALNTDRTPKVIISASGMCEAGRIKHHLKHNLWDSRNSVIFVGYQAEGTLGRLITDGMEEVRIFGEPIHVGAEIYDLKGFSGHADQKGLEEWLSAFEPHPAQVFLVHGEKESKLDFAALIEKELGIKAVAIMEPCLVDIADEISVKRKGREQAEIKLEQLIQMRHKLSEVHHNLEHILYTTELAADDTMTEERIRQLNDILLSLEKDSLNLGSAVTDLS